MTKTAGGATAAYAVVTCLFFAWGFITSNTDPLIAAMRGIYTLNVAEGMLTQFAFFLAYFVISLPAAALLARLGHSRTIITALMVMIGACLLMLAASHMEAYAMVLVALFVMASGITVLQVAANPLAASLGAPERSHFRLTFAQAFNSLGVVLGVSIGSKIMLRPDVFGQGRAYPGRRAAQHGAGRDRPCLRADRRRGRGARGADLRLSPPHKQLGRQHHHPGRVAPQGADLGLGGVRGNCGVPLCRGRGDDRQRDDQLPQPARCARPAARGGGRGAGLLLLGRRAGGAGSSAACC